TGSASPNRRTRRTALRARRDGRAAGSGRERGHSRHRTLAAAGGIRSPRPCRVARRGGGREDRGMVGSVAVLADVHGVLPALEAVLGEPDVRAAELIVLPGDIAAGPLPVETLDLLTSLGERVVWVRGNADRELVALARGGRTSIPDPIAPWAASRLRPDQVDLLDRLPHPV